MERCVHCCRVLLIESYSDYAFQMIGCDNDNCKYQWVRILNHLQIECSLTRGFVSSIYRAWESASHSRRAGIATIA